MLLHVLVLCFLALRGVRRSRTGRVLIALRDNGHLEYVKKAAKCEDFFAGLQWDQNDLALLKAQRRPALTINKIISTISNVMGEQIFNRADARSRPAVV